MTDTDVVEEEDHKCSDCEMDPCECCDRCGGIKGHCDMCDMCGDSHVEDCYSSYCYSCAQNYCDDCESMECCCGEGMGSMDRAPWEVRGIKVSNVITGDWTEHWNIDTNIDPVQSAADFYLLEALSSGVLLDSRDIQPFRIDPSVDVEFFDKMGIAEDEQEQFVQAREKHFTAKEKQDPRFHMARLMGKAEVLLESLVDDLDQSLLNYGQMAVAGELRHHRAIGHRVLEKGDRSGAWCGWPAVAAAVGPDALLDAATLFRDFSRNGYGGEPWAVCAEVVHARIVGSLGPDGPEGKINRRLFCDRVWTLEHNGGSFLNKISWAINNAKHYNVNHMKFVLDAHASDPPDVKTLKQVASAHIVALFDKMSKLKNNESTAPKMVAKLNLISNWSGLDEPISAKISIPFTLENLSDANWEWNKEIHAKRFGKNIPNRGTWLGTQAILVTYNEDDDHVHTVEFFPYLGHVNVYFKLRSLLNSGVFN